jgi:hypothetical protein
MFFLAQFGTQCIFILCAFLLFTIVSLKIKHVLYDIKKSKTSIKDPVFTKIGYKAFVKYDNYSHLYAFANFKYEVDKVYELFGELAFCKNGFHYCTEAVHIDNYYKPGPNIVYGIVEILGDHKTDNKTHKSITNKIKITKVIDRKELMKYFNGLHSYQGNNVWYVNGVIHREGNEPAIITSDGTRQWIQNGKFHSDAMHPAIQHANGDKIWLNNGKYHSYNDQPALITNVTKQWYKDGVLHRSNDMPAIIRSDGTHEWYKDGVLHRSNDMPAVIKSDGTREWYKYGKLHRSNDMPAVIKSDGSQKWYKEGKLHRAGNKPAINKYGKIRTKAWYIDGKLRRDNDQPAQITIMGKNKIYLEWYINGLRHRNNKQPAIVSSFNKTYYWYENGENITQIIKKERKEKMSKKKNMRNAKKSW